MFKIKKVHVKIQISASEKPEDLGISLHFPTRINDFKSSGLFFFFSRWDEQTPVLKLPYFPQHLKHIILFLYCAIHKHFRLWFLL